MKNFLKGPWLYIAAGLLVVWAGFSFLTTVNYAPVSTKEGLAFIVDGKVKEILEEQAPGGWYLSSSALINHAPEYPATDGYANRIAAIQARFIYLTEDLKAFRASVGDGAGWSNLVKILSETLSTSSVASPSVALVDSILNERRNDPPRPR